MIRPARAEDAPALLALMNALIRDTTVNFNATERTLPQIEAMIAERAAGGPVMLVAELDGCVVGYATYGPFRPSVGYQPTVEHSILLGDSARGLGFGRALLTGVEDHAQSAGAHVIVAAISGENVAGQAFHAAMGYAEVGRMPQVGRKFDRWLDLVLMQKFLA